MKASWLFTALLCLQWACTTDDLITLGRPCSDVELCGPGAICDQASRTCVAAGQGTEDSGPRVDQGPGVDQHAQRDDAQQQDLPPADDLFTPDKPWPKDLGPDAPWKACYKDSDCDDKNACTTNKCVNGSCSYPKLTCPPTTNPCKKEACYPATGCAIVDKTNGTPCSDNKYCTVNDACQAGTCTGQARDCSASAPACKHKGVCNEASKACTYSDQPDGTACDDKDACTQGTTCSNGVCTAPGPKVETITSPFPTHWGTDRSLAVDGKGAVHVVHYHYYANRLHYSTNAGGSWKTTILDQPGSAGGDVGSDPAIAIDAGGNLHVIYNDWGNKQMKYAYKASTSTTWAKSILASGHGHCSIVAGTGGVLHISYRQNRALWYGKRTTGPWSLTKVEELPSTSTAYPGIDSSIALDSTGAPHIAHGHGSYQGGGAWYCDKLRHAYLSGSSWQNEDAAPNMGTTKTGSMASLAIDSQDTLLISHWSSGGGLLLSTKTKTGTWKVQTLLTGQTGSFTSILVNGKDHVHIAYRNYGAAGDLRYITNATGAWKEQTLDAGGESGRWSTIAQAPSGRLHIVHDRDGPDVLRHVYLSACP